MALSWTMPGTGDRDQLLEHARGAIPGYFGKADRAGEDLEAFAEMLSVAAGQVADWIRRTYLEYAERTWLDEHAADRGTRRQTGESDDELRLRLRVPTDVVTRPALLARTDDLLAAAGVVGSASMAEGADLGFFLFDTPVTPGDADGFGFLAEGDGVAFGYRWLGRTTVFIIFLPSATGGGTAAAIATDIVRHRAGGITSSVEAET